MLYTSGGQKSHTGLPGYTCVSRCQQGCAHPGRGSVSLLLPPLLADARTPWLVDHSSLFEPSVLPVPDHPCTVTSLVWLQLTRSQRLQGEMCESSNPQVFTAFYRVRGCILWAKYCQWKHSIALLFLVEGEATPTPGFRVFSPLLSLSSSFMILWPKRNVQHDCVQFIILSITFIRWFPASYASVLVECDATSWVEEASPGHSRSESIGSRHFVMKGQRSHEFRRAPLAEERIPGTAVTLPKYSSKCWLSHHVLLLIPTK